MEVIYCQKYILFTILNLATLQKMAILHLLLKPNLANNIHLDMPETFVLLS